MYHSTNSAPRLPVVLDAGPAVHQRAGLAHYTERLAAHLLREHGAQIDLTLFYNAHSNHQLPDTLRHAPTRTIPRGQYAWRLSALLGHLLRWPLYQQIISAISTNKPINQSTTPLYHATEHLLPYLRTPTVLTVHDLIFLRQPQHHTRRNRLFLQLAMPRFVRAADAIIAVSQHTRRDLLELYRTPAEKIHVIHEGIDAAFAPAGADEIARVRAAYSPERPYLLMVGTLEPRKNHAEALRTLARLKAAGFPHCLVIVGGAGWLFEPVRALVDELDLAGDVHFTGYVPAADLPPLYSGAACFLLPSLYEGFGFTVLEAMACGAPVVCSNVSSLPEVVGHAALTVSPHDEEALLAAVQRVLQNQSLAQSLRQRGMDRAAQFQWARCAAATVEVYRETAARYRYNVVQMRERGTLDKHKRSV